MSLQQLSTESHVLCPRRFAKPAFTGFPEMTCTSREFQYYLPQAPMEFAPMSHDESEPLFRSALDAVRWALCEERAALQQSSLYRSPGAGRGLSGYEAAGQAGIIMAKVRLLARPHSAIVVAQAAPVKLPCSCGRDCCSRWRSNPLWVGAVEDLTAWWNLEVWPDFKRPQLVRACLRRFFGENIGIEAIAKRNGVGRTVVVEANGEILKPVKSQRDAAWRELEESLANAGLTESGAQKAA